MRRCLWFVICGVLLLPAAWGRTWTSRKGKTVEGEYKGLMDKTTVLIARESSGKTIRISLANLCDEDQAYVKARAGLDKPRPATKSESMSDEDKQYWRKILAAGAAVIIGAILVGLAIYVLFSTVVIHIAAKLAHFEGGIFRAFIASIAVIFLSASSAVVLWYAAKPETAAAAGVGVDLVATGIGLKLAYSKEELLKCIVVAFLVDILKTVFLVILVLVIIFAVLALVAASASGSAMILGELAVAPLLFA